MRAAEVAIAGWGRRERSDSEMISHVCMLIGGCYKANNALNSEQSATDGSECLADGMVYMTNAVQSAYAVIPCVLCLLLNSERSVYTVSECSRWRRWTTASLTTCRSWLTSHSLSTAIGLWSCYIKHINRNYSVVHAACSD